MRLPSLLRRPAPPPADALPGPEAFSQSLRVELMRADRGRSRFCLAVFDLSDWAASGDERADGFAAYLAGRLRATDYAGLLGAGRVGVILWDTDEAGAARFVDKIRSGWVAARSPDAVIYAYPSDRPIGEPPTAARRSVALPDGFADAICPGSPGPVCRGEEADADHDRSSAPSSGDDGHAAALESDADCTAAPDAERTGDPQAIARCESAEVEDSDDPPPVPVLPLEEILLCPLPAWKRAVDVVGAAAGLIALAPLLATVAAAVKWTSRGPALFSQTRDGLGGRKFQIYKFRTMVTDAEALKDALRTQSEQDGPAFKMEHDPRITPLGRWLRKTCVDELPQLWNVLIGDMSLVGPRPLESKESAQTAWWERRRLLVTPGLTCIWQVDGKSKVTFKEWMRMDIRYMHDRSFVGDLGLILRTALNIALHRGSH